MMLWVTDLHGLCLQEHWVTRAFPLWRLKPVQTWQLYTKGSWENILSPDQGHFCFSSCLRMQPEHWGRACFWKRAPCSLTSWAPKRTALFFVKTERAVDIPVGKWCLALAALWPDQLGHSLHCRRRGGEVLGGLAFSMDWGLYWNSSAPCLLFVTKSHGSVFSVLFFFLSFFFKFLFLGHKISHLNNVPF